MAVESVATLLKEKEALDVINVKRSFRLWIMVGKGFEKGTHFPSSRLLMSAEAAKAAL